MEDSDDLEEVDSNNVELDEEEFRVLDELKLDCLLLEDEELLLDCVEADDPDEDESELSLD